MELSICATTIFAIDLSLDFNMPSPADNNTEKTLSTVPSKKGERLSKHQIQFDLLVTKIDTLRAQLLEDKEKLQKLLFIYLKKVSPHNRRAAELQFELAKEFANVIDSLKLGSKLKEEVENVVVWLLDQSFLVIEPDKEKKDFFNLWSKQSYDERHVEENYRDESGRQLEVPEEEMEKNNGSQQGQKTKKQIERALKQKKLEEAKAKSIRNVYVSLAKMLHPDTVTDLDEKKVKEELMKNVTVAYKNKNLSELLKLEMEWVATESMQGKNLTEEKLKLYISQLQEQARELEAEHSFLKQDGRYLALSHLFKLSDKAALKKLKELSRIAESRVSTLEHIVRVLQRNPTRKTVLDYLKEFSLVKDF